MISKLRSLPHILLFKRTAARTAIEKDMLRWIQMYRSGESSHSSTEILTWLLDGYPEFRNLFYVRIGRYSSLSGRLVVWLSKQLYPPLEGLYFAEPANIGPGLFIYRGFGSLLGFESMGENCSIGPGCTFGYKCAGGGLPNFGNNITIGAGAKVLGGVKVGDNVIIGANAVVVKDVPPHCTVVGVPARIIKRNGLKVR